MKSRIKCHSFACIPQLRVKNQALPRCGRLSGMAGKLPHCSYWAKEARSFLICINVDRREEDATVIYQKAPHYRSGEQE
jgi:hypothetical protein